MTTQDDKTDTILAALLKPFTVLPPFPTVPSAEELYDHIMAGIEPELTSSQVPLLKEKYAGQSTQDKEQREMRYKQAFDRFDAAMNDYFDKLHATVQTHQHTTMKSLETVEQESNKQELDRLESAFDDAA